MKDTSPDLNDVTNAEVTLLRINRSVHGVPVDGSGPKMSLTTHCRELTADYRDA